MFFELDCSIIRKLLNNWCLITLYLDCVMNTIGTLIGIRPLPPLVNLWSLLTTGLNNECYAMAIDPSGNVYVGGIFTTAGNVSASRIAKWSASDSTWSALGSGLNYNCLALAVDSSGDVYAGGDFTTAGGITVNYMAKWTVSTSTWSAFGAGANAPCYALAYDSTRNIMYAGNPSVINGVGVYGLAKYNMATSTWSAVDSRNGVSGGAVRAIALDSSGNVYIGGFFTTAGPGTINRIARWNIANSTWSNFGTGMDSWVYAIAIDSANNIYAGGNFSTAGGSTANYVAKWAGGGWSAMGTGLNDTCYAMVIGSSGKVYMCGNFTTAGGSAVKNIATWDASTSTWSTPSTAGLNGVGFALSMNSSKNTMYIGGVFTNATNLSANRIVKYGGGVL